MIAQPYCTYYWYSVRIKCREKCDQTGPRTQTTYTHPHTERCLWEFDVCSDGISESEPANSIQVVFDYWYSWLNLSVRVCLFFLKVVKKCIINGRETDSGPHTPTECKILLSALQQLFWKALQLSFRNLLSLSFYVSRQFFTPLHQFFPPFHIKTHSFFGLCILTPICLFWLLTALH